MTKTNLIAKAIAIPFNSEIIQKLRTSYAVLIALPLAGEIYSDFFVFFTLIGMGLFFPISMTALRSYEDKSTFVVPSKELILKKFWKVFQVTCVVLPIFFLGLICLIFPGLIIMKRYIYVYLISEQEMLGPLEAMRNSKELSMKNGWKLLLMTLILTLIITPFSVISTSLSDSNPGIITFTLELAIFWITTLSSTAICFYGYKEAFSND